jgi:hypothetical protein
MANPTINNEIEIFTIITTVILKNFIYLHVFCIVIHDIFLKYIFIKNKLK